MVPRLANYDEITLRSLLNHTSGVSEHVYTKEMWDLSLTEPDRTFEPEELVAYILDREPHFSVGEGWSYADTNFILVGMVINKITESTYYEELRKRVLVPLELKDTVPSDRRDIEGVVPGYTRKGTFGIPVSKVIDESGLFVLNPQLEWTGGGIASTPLDLARWGKLLYEGKAFDPKHLSAVLDGNPANTGRGDEYGLGTQIWSTPQGRVHGHTGFFPGYQSAMAYYPEAKFVLATQFNTDQREHLRRPARSYLNEFAGMIIE